MNQQPNTLSSSIDMEEVPYRMAGFEELSGFDQPRPSVSFADGDSRCAAWKRTQQHRKFKNPKIPNFTAQNFDRPKTDAMSPTKQIAAAVRQGAAVLGGGKEPRYGRF